SLLASPHRSELERDGYDAHAVVVCRWRSDGGVLAGSVVWDFSWLKDLEEGREQRAPAAQAQVNASASAETLGRPGLATPGHPGPTKRPQTTPKFTTPGPTRKQVLVLFPKDVGVPKMSLNLLTTTVNAALHSVQHSLKVLATTRAYEGWALATSGGADESTLNTIRGEVLDLVPDRYKESHWVGLPTLTLYLKIIDVPYFKDIMSDDRITASDVKNAIAQSPLSNDFTFSCRGWSGTLLRAPPVQCSSIFGTLNQEPVQSASWTSQYTSKGTTVWFDLLQPAQVSPCARDATGGATLALHAALRSSVAPNAVAPTKLMSIGWLRAAARGLYPLLPWRSHVLTHRYALFVRATTLQTKGPALSGTTALTESGSKLNMLRHVNAVLVQGPLLRTRKGREWWVCQITHRGQ
ncbi:hypothetical protein AAF712_016791, partial [Marasmius tenuissimus]